MHVRLSGHGNERAKVGEERFDSIRFELVCGGRAEVLRYDVGHPHARHEICIAEERRCRRSHDRYSGTIYQPYPKKRGPKITAGWSSCAKSVILQLLVAK